MLNGKKISVIIPVFNEEESIGKVLKEIPADIADDVIVVDNGSTDRTSQMARESGARTLMENHKGYGAACLKGIREAEGADIVVILDGDYSDYPDQMVRIVEPIADGEADFVIGSRVMGKRENGALAPQAYWGNKLAAFLIGLFFGYKYSDMGPFRAIRYDRLKEMAMEDKDFGWNVEMQVKAVRQGLRIKEVPVDYRMRIGKSKISGTVKGTLLAGIKIICTIFKYVLIVKD